MTDYPDIDGSKNFANRLIVRLLMQEIERHGCFVSRDLADFYDGIGYWPVGEPLEKGVSPATLEQCLAHVDTLCELVRHCEDEASRAGTPARA